MFFATLKFYAIFHIWLKKGKFPFFQNFFCMSKIHIQTNFHENGSKIYCFIGKNRQKTTMANLYGGYFICPYCQKSGFKLPITVFGFFSQNLLSIVDTYKFGLKLNNKQFLDTNYLETFILHYI